MNTWPTCSICLAFEATTTFCKEHRVIASNSQEQCAERILLLGSSWLSHVLILPAISPRTTAFQTDPSSHTSMLACPGITAGAGTPTSAPPRRPGTAERAERKRGEQERSERACLDLFLSLCANFGEHALMEHERGAEEEEKGS